MSPWINLKSLSTFFSFFLIWEENFRSKNGEKINWNKKKALQSSREQNNFKKKWVFFVLWQTTVTNKLLLSFLFFFLFIFSFLSFSCPFFVKRMKKNSKNDWVRVLLQIHGLSLWSFFWFMRLYRPGMLKELRSQYLRKRAKEGWTAVYIFGNVFFFAFGPVALMVKVAAVK